MIAWETGGGRFYEGDTKTSGKTLVTILEAKGYYTFLMGDGNADRTKDRWPRNSCFAAEALITVGLMTSARRMPKKEEEHLTTHTHLARLHNQPSVPKGGLGKRETQNLSKGRGPETKPHTEELGDTE